VDAGIQAIFMAINHCVDPVSKNQFEFWYKYLNVVRGDEMHHCKAGIQQGRQTR